MTNRNAQELAESVLSLYDVSTDTDETLRKYYLPDATFTDPIVSVQGLENIQAQFRSLPKFVKSSKATLVRGSMAGSSVLTIDSSVIYRLKPFPSIMKIVLRVFTVIELKNGKIQSHTDHFDFYSVLANVPLVSFVYAHFRPTFGAVSSAVIKRLMPSKQQQQKQVRHAVLDTANAGTNGVAVATQ